MTMPAVGWRTMTTNAAIDVVFDCVVYLQAMTHIHGPAGQCLTALEHDAIRLWISDAILSEIRQLPDKPGVQRMGCTFDRAERLADYLQGVCQYIAFPPAVFVHPIDPNDSCYVNLAIAANAHLIVSRDNHLLHLTNPAKPWSKLFRDSFPSIRIVTPVQLLQMIGQKRS